MNSTSTLVRMPLVFVNLAFLWFHTSDGFLANPLTACNSLNNNRSTSDRLMVQRQIGLSCLLLVYTLLHTITHPHPLCLTPSTCANNVCQFCCSFFLFLFVFREPIRIIHCDGQWWKDKQMDNFYLNMICIFKKLNCIHKLLCGYCWSLWRTQTCVI